MAFAVVNGATILCAMGTAPGVLNVISQHKVLVGGLPAATIQDVTPLAGVGPCGLCTSLANPTVQAATTAALGVLTPMPCVPAPAGVWMCGKAPLLCGIPGLSSEGKLMCSYGGSISITLPGQMKVTY